MIALSAGVTVNVARRPPSQGIGISLGHRPENVTFHAAQGEQRQECSDNDRRSKKDRTRDVGSSTQDRVFFYAHHGFGRNRALLFRGQLRRMRQTPEDRLHRDDGAVHDQAEIDGADGQQICRTPRAIPG